MVYKALHGMAPEYISNIFLKKSDIHSRNLPSVESETLKTSYYEHTLEPVIMTVLSL